MLLHEVRSCDGGRHEMRQCRSGETRGTHEHEHGCQHQQEVPEIDVDVNIWRR